MSFNTWEHFDSPKTLFPYCNQSLNSNERVKWLELQASTEDIPKADVERGLRSATRQSRKGAYRKGRHSFAILGKLDADKVCAASPHAKRLIETLLANNPSGDVV